MNIDHIVNKILNEITNTYSRGGYDYPLQNKILKFKKTSLDPFNVVHKLKEVIPIKLEVKRVKLTIPAQFTGQVYGLLGDYKEKEEWLSNGNLEVVLAIPSGVAIDFFDKINSLTHGAVQSEEVSSE